MNFDARNETARGYLLLGVFFIHALYDVSGDFTGPAQAPATFALIKLLAPQISVFFLLSGMSSQRLGQRSLRSVLQQSLMLIGLAWLSEIVGLIMENLVFGGFGHGVALLRHIVKPIIYGTGGCTNVTWFFTVLAAARILAWLFERSKPGFAGAWVVIVLAILAARHLHLPDNLWEWRNWPVATLFMLAGMKLPKHWRVSWQLGFASLFVGLALTWFNVPLGWQHPLCLTCHLDYVAQPMVGEAGVPPVYLLQTILFFTFMLWASAATKPASPGRVARYFGRASLQFLLLHGWLLVTILPIAIRLMPAQDSAAILIGLLIVNPLVHAGTFAVVAPAINKSIALCSKASHAVINAVPRRTPARA